jgi:Cutinase
MQLPSLLLALAAATTAYPSPQGKSKGAFSKGGSSGGCSPVEMIFARGTMEGQGFGMVGQPLVAATRNLIPAFTAVALKYPASWGDASPAAGVKAVVEYFDTKPKQCPQQK